MCKRVYFKVKLQYYCEIKRALRFAIGTKQDSWLHIELWKIPQIDGTEMACLYQREELEYVTKVH